MNRKLSINVNAGGSASLEVEGSPAIYFDSYAEWRSFADSVAQADKSAREMRFDDIRGGPKGGGKSRSLEAFDWIVCALGLAWLIGYFG